MLCAVILHCVSTRSSAVAEGPRDAPRQSRSCQLPVETSCTTNPAQIEAMEFQTYSHTHTHPFNGPFPGLPRVSRYQKGKTNLDFTEARDSEWQWHQLGHMQVCTSLQTDNHTSNPPLSFLQAGCPSCRPANSVKALKGRWKIAC